MHGQANNNVSMYPQPLATELRETGPLGSPDIYCDIEVATSFAVLPV